MYLFFTNRNIIPVFWKIYDCHDLLQTKILINKLEKSIYDIYYKYNIQRCRIRHAGATHTCATASARGHARARVRRWGKREAHARWQCSRPAHTSIRHGRADRVQHCVMQANRDRFHVYALRALHRPDVLFERLPRGSDHPCTFNYH